MIQAVVALRGVAQRPDIFPGYVQRPRYFSSRCSSFFAVLPAAPISSEWFRRWSWSMTVDSSLLCSYSRLDSEGGSEITPFESSRVTHIYLVHSHFDYLEYFYIFGTLPVERDIRNFAPCKIRSNFGKYFPLLRRSIYSYLGNLFVRNFTRISFRNRKLSRLCSIRTIVS